MLAITLRFPLPIFSNKSKGFEQNTTYSEIGLFLHCCVEPASPRMSDHFPHLTFCTEMRGKTRLVFFLQKSTKNNPFL
jgi:hypothetical protein